MDIYPQFGTTGKLQSFEISNDKLSRFRVAKIVAAVPRVVVTKRPKRFFSWFREEIFCEFEINGVKFDIEEPFGDNSRYSVGNKGHCWCKELELIKKAFEAV